MGTGDIFTSWEITAAMRLSTWRFLKSSRILETFEIICFKSVRDKVPSSVLTETLSFGKYYT